MTLIRSRAVSMAETFETDLIAVTKRAKASSNLAIKQLGFNAEVVYHAGLIFARQQSGPDLSSVSQKSK